jgi:hypothetical protein
VTVDPEDLRLAIYRQLAHTGRAPARAELGDDEGLRRLHEQRHVVLGDDGEIVMAHPFATIPLGFSVMGARTLWWGGCAWDSFAIPHLVPGEPSVLVATTCPACAAPHAWTVTNERPPDGDQVAHFLVPVPHIWDDVVHSCGNQRIYCSEACVTAWLERTGEVEGSTFDLATLWRLARGWYAGRLERGYTRREPSEAAAYFAEVGLSGPFWGIR